LHKIKIRPRSTIKENDILYLRFYGDVKELLKTQVRQDTFVQYRLNRRASIKDIIEALGIPHTEIGSITKSAKELDFAFVPEGGEQLDIRPNSGRFLPTSPSTLRPLPIPSYRFLVDINAARLAGHLRMVGLDAESVLESDNLRSKQDIAEAGAAEDRILISRDRELLKLRLVTFGRLLRNHEPFDQLLEIIHLYRLHSELSPFCRCMKCNHLLEPVTKAAIVDKLEPLTKKYYSVFKQCVSCSSIYWKGSHHQHMLEKLKPILARQKLSS